MIMTFQKIIFSLIIPALFLLSCGEGTVDPAHESYEPRIVIEGFLEANKNIDRLRITRNFKVDVDLTKSSVIPDPDETTVLVTDVAADQVYTLSFYDEDEGDAYWHYTGTDLIIQSGKTYRLEVWSKIEGQRLYATAETTIPAEGFAVKEQNYHELRYRQRDSSGNLMQFELTLERSPGSSYYMALISAQDPKRESFIYDNPYEDKEPGEVNLVDDAFNYEVYHHMPQTSGQSRMMISWHNFKFYTDYKIIAYVTDDNYKDFFITFRNVMEPDGNIHEPKFNVKGDGIGVFGSLIADTVHCRVTR